MIENDRYGKVIGRHDPYKKKSTCVMNNNYFVKMVVMVIVDTTFCTVALNYIFYIK